MAKSFDEAQIVSKYVHDLVRRRALKALSGHDAKLSQVFDKIAAGIRKDLRAAGFTVKQVREVLDKHLAGTLDERTKIVEDAIIGAAREARTLDKETFEAIFGAEEVAAAPAPLDRSSQPARVLSLKRRNESEGEPR